MAACLLGAAAAAPGLPGAGAAGPPPEPAPGGAAGLLFGRALDPNRAAAAALEALPGIGPGRAAAIVAARAAQPFCRVDELQRVRGIGPRTLAAAAPGLAVREPPAGCARGAAGEAGVPGYRGRETRRAAPRGGEEPGR